MSPAEGFFNERFCQKAKRRRRRRRSDDPVRILDHRAALAQKYPEAGLRRRFQNDPYLDQVTLGQVLQDPFALSDFLMMCRRLPQCGDASVDLLRRILESAARNVETRH